MVLHPVAQIHAKMVEHVRYQDQVTFAIVILDTGDQIVKSRLVAQIHVKTVGHVMLSMVLMQPILTPANVIILGRVRHAKRIY